MSTFVTMNCTRFDFPTARDIEINGVKFGKISPKSERGVIKSLVIEGRIFKCYTGTYLETIEETIYIGINEYDTYKKESKFNIYIQESNNNPKKILVEATTNIGVKYLKKLAKAFPNRISYTTISFDFRKIVTISDVGSLWFKDNDQNVNSKGYFGSDIELNTDVDNAITNDTATYVSVNMDVGGISRALGFSKKGAIVVRNNIPGNAEGTQYLIAVCQIFQLLGVAN